MHEEPRRNLEIAAIKSKRYYDRKAIVPKFQVGDLVWLYQPTKIKGQNRNLIPSWIGPYKVIGKLTEVIYRIENARPGVKRTRRNWIKTVHADRLRSMRQPDTRTSRKADPTGKQPSSSGISSVSTMPNPPKKTAYHPEIVTQNMSGIRTRKPNARRIFPVLKVQLINTT